MGEKIEINNKNKQTEQGGLEKKLEKIQEERDRLQQEIEEVKMERDKKIQEHKAMLDKERDNYKSKLRESESKSSKTEAKQTQLLLSFEQERAKFETEKNFLIS